MSRKNGHAVAVLALLAVPGCSLLFDNAPQRPWERLLDAPGKHEVAAVVANADEIFLCVNFDTSFAADGELVSTSDQTDIVVLGLGNDGIVRRHAVLAGNGNERCGAMIADGEGGLFVLGSYDQAFTIDSTELAAPAGIDLFVARLDADLTPRPLLRLGTPGGMAGGMIDDDIPGALALSTDRRTLFLGGRLGGGEIQSDLALPSQLPDTFDGVWFAAAVAAAGDGDFVWINGERTEIDSASVRVNDLAVHADTVYAAATIGTFEIVDSLQQTSADAFVVATSASDGSERWRRAVASAEAGSDNGLAVAVAAQGLGTVCLGGRQGKRHGRPEFAPTHDDATGANGGFAACFRDQGSSSLPLWLRTFGQNDGLERVDSLAVVDNQLWLGASFSASELQVDDQTLSHPDASGSRIGLLLGLDPTDGSCATPRLFERSETLLVVPAGPSQLAVASPETLSSDESDSHVARRDAPEIICQSR